jgi:hypothetical protein
MAAAIILLLANSTLAVPARAHRSLLTGPWELAVQIGHKGQMVRFPLKVADEDKPELIDRHLPLMGTPITIKVEQYLPDLTWQSSAVEDANGGIVVKLIAEGKDFEQEIWLSSDEPTRRSMSSTIGGVALRRLNDPNSLENLLRELIDSNGVGILSVWPQEANAPSEYVARAGETIIIPDSKYKVTILRYVPHYSIDTRTKDVTSRSDKPLNPAVKVGVDTGESTYEQWLWSKSASPHHQEKKYPLRMKFADVDLGSTQGKYILATAFESEPWVLYSKKARIHMEKAVSGKLYPFANKEYSFRIDKIFSRSVIKTEWKNDSEELLHPAVVATIEESDTQQRAVLEFNKPTHLKTRFGTLVLLYRRQ